jgi:hypothetical protein
VHKKESKTCQGRTKCPQRINQKHINGTQICTKRNQQHTKEKLDANKLIFENLHIQEEPKTHKGNPNVHKEEPRTCQGKMETHKGKLSVHKEDPRTNKGRTKCSHRKHLKPTQKDPKTHKGNCNMHKEDLGTHQG